MKKVHFLLVMSFLSVSFISNAQFQKQWEIDEPGFFIGQANCDNDSNLELLFLYNDYDPWLEYVVVIDGVTGEKEFETQPGWFKWILDVYFVDVNTDGKSEILMRAATGSAINVQVYSYGPLGINDEGTVEMGFAAQNYPNPFDASTRIAYSVEKQGAKVEIQIFDQKGNLVMTMDEGIKHRGSHQLDWNGRDSSGKELTPGMYMHKVVVDGKVKTNKMIKL